MRGRNIFGGVVGVIGSGREKREEANRASQKNEGRKRNLVMKSIRMDT